MCKRKAGSFDDATLRLWRQAALGAVEVPGSVDGRLLGEVVLKLLDSAERVARVEALIGLADIMTLRAIVANWRGGVTVELIGCDDLSLQLGRALDALGAAIGQEERVREAGAVMEQMALRDAGVMLGESDGG